MPTAPARTGSSPTTGRSGSIPSGTRSCAASGPASRASTAAAPRRADPHVTDPADVGDLEVPGVRIGHWTDTEARTGCTVVRFPEGTVASGEVRGGAPATREFALLAPERLVERIDALVLSGGSAFGLAAGDGVMALLAEEEVGFATGA